MRDGNPGVRFTEIAASLPPFGLLILAPFGAFPTSVPIHQSGTNPAPANMIVSRAQGPSVAHGRLCVKRRYSESDDRIPTTARLNERVRRQTSLVLTRTADAHCSLVVAPVFADKRVMLKEAASREL